MDALSTAKYTMFSNADISNHVTSTLTSWTCIPLPPAVTHIPDNPFSGLAVSTLVDCAPQLLAHILRTKANEGVQVVSPKQVPLLAVIERIDPYKRQADHIVVTTQASANTSWPTVDGRTLDHLFPGEPNRCGGADASQVKKTKTRVIGKAMAMTAATDPISRAIVRSASIIDIQRRPDVAGDADMLAEILDVAWALPLGTFGTLAPLVLASSEDLLRTAISTDHNAPDALMSIQRKRVIHVCGGMVGREAYGTYIGMDWARQRAIARSIFHLSCSLEGMNLMPTSLVWPAADMRAPVHSSEREKHLVFQPRYGSALRVDPATFRFTRPDDVPPSFACCTGLNAPNAVITVEELDEVLAVMVASGLPRTAAETVRKTFAMNSVSRIVMGEKESSVALLRGSNVSTLVVPKKGSLAIATTAVSLCLNNKLARGATPAKVLRSRIYDIMQSVESIELIPIFLTISTLKKEAVYYDLPLRPYALLKQLASRLSHALGSMMVRSLALEAARTDALLEDWFAIALETVPKPIRPDECSALGWATIAIWNMWSGTTGKWVGALRSATHNELTKLASATMRVKTMQISLMSEDPILEAAKCALAACQEMYAPYYERMYDYYCLLCKNSPFLTPIGVGNTQTYFRVSKTRKRASLIAYIAAGLWQLRGRHLRSARVVEIVSGSPDTKGMERRFPLGVREFAIMVAPNKAYESFRKSITVLLEPGEVNPMKSGEKGDIRHVVASHKAPMFDDFEGICEGMFMMSRLARYVADPNRWAIDLERTYDEVVREVAGAAATIATQNPVPITSEVPLPPVTMEMAAMAPASAIAVREALASRKTGEVAKVVMSFPAPAKPIFEPNIKTGWVYARLIYGTSLTDVVMDIEDVGTEDDVAKLMNSAYASQEKFIAALEAFYGETVAPGVDKSKMTASLNW